MAATSILTWVHVLSTVAILAFYIAALGYVLTRKTDRSTAKTLATASLAIMFLLHLGSFGFTFLIAQTSTPIDAAFWQGLFSVVSSLVYLIAVGMLVAAVFAPGPSTGLPESRDRSRPLIDPHNPYSPTTD